MQQTSPAEQHWYVLALVEALSWLTADTVRDDDEILPVNGLRSSIGEASKNAETGTVSSVDTNREVAC